MQITTGSDKLAEVYMFYMSTSCQPGSRVIRAFSDVEKTFLFSDLAATKSENKKVFSTSQKARLISRVNKFYGHGRRGNSHFVLFLHSTAEFGSIREKQLKYCTANICFEAKNDAIEKT